jgi:hypothetical protein
VYVSIVDSSSHLESKYQQSATSSHLHLHHHLQIPPVARLCKIPHSPAVPYFPPAALRLVLSCCVRHATAPLASGLLLHGVCPPQTHQKSNPTRILPRSFRNLSPRSIWSSRKSITYLLPNQRCLTSRGRYFFCMVYRVVPVKLPVYPPCKGVAMDQDPSNEARRTRASTLATNVKLRNM